LKNGRLIFRDIQKYDDRYTERYLTTACEGWQATYDALPVVDNRLWSKDECECAWVFKDTAERLVGSCENQNGELEVAVGFANGHRGTLTFSETGFKVSGCGELLMEFGIGEDLRKVSEGTLFFEHNGFAYTVGIDGEIRHTDRGYAVKSDFEIKMS
jgi:hypothetical protein